MHPSHKILFEPVKIGPVISRNRFYQTPHGTGAAHLPQVDAGIKGMRAEGGWGVVSCEYCSIHPDFGFDYGDGLIRKLWHDRHIAEQAVTVEAIHRHGALAATELAHGGLVSFNHLTKGPVYAPSSQMALSSMIVPQQARAMDRRQIREVLEWQRAAAVRARKAGFDIVYVYAAHDLGLPQHFLSPLHNKRTDEYGGSLENRARLLREMIDVTREAVADQCAVAVRLCVDELMGLDGITADREGRQVIEMLGELPDLWDVNVGGAVADIQPSRFAKEGWQEEYISFVKKCATKPVVGVGRFTSPDTMASQVRRGILDLIGAARPSIADPFLPKKIEEGRAEDIRECIGCNYCLKTQSFGHSGCTQNPTMGQEWRLAWHPERIERGVSETSILVVGAGPAGLETTRALAQRGYPVTLAEASIELGGRAKRESCIPGLQEWVRVADWRISQITKSPQVAIYKGNCLTAEDILQLEHEHVIIATGSRWRRDGVGLTNRTSLTIHSNASIFTPDDLMDGRFPEQGPVIVFDDDQYYLGVALAEKLRRRHLEVKLITPGHSIAKYTDNPLELQRMHKLGVRLSVHTNLVQVIEGELVTQCLLSGELSTLPAAAVVLVTSREPIDSLYWELTADEQRRSESGIISVDLIGDAKVPDTIARAVFDAHRYAREFEGEPIDFATLRPATRTPY